VSSFLTAHQYNIGYAVPQHVQRSSTMHLREKHTTWGLTLRPALTHHLITNTSSN